MSDREERINSISKAQNLQRSKINRESGKGIKDQRNEAIPLREIAFYSFTYYFLLFN